MGIARRVSERRRKTVRFARRQRVLAPLCGGVDVAQWQPRLVGEVPLEQPVRADDLERQSLACRGELKLLAAGHDEALRLHPADERNDHGIRQPHGPCQGRDRPAASAVLLLEQVLERVLQPAPLADGLLHPPPEEDTAKCRECNE